MGIRQRDSVPFYTISITTTAPNHRDLLYRIRGRTTDLYDRGDSTITRSAGGMENSGEGQGWFVLGLVCRTLLAVNWNYDSGIDKDDEIISSVYCYGLRS
ncbi:hypothetical protein GWI33_015843 [Rhynchophorus ferrugineus]|uniref:Uncharacterized protein n=1 Tax=Rhynchophorus ferrugineus TaxID=354439 RepID=A0A834M9A1_RHYFE|nr:hypothetical protein GWI33_015843 [Rhynchophorus ferrugineus]